MSLPAQRFPANPDDPDARPRPLGERLKLLLILLVIPAVAVTLPTLAVTGIFGQRPKPKKAAATPPPTVAAAVTDGLTASLRRSAESLLPTPAPLTTEPIAVRVRADHVAARAEKVASQAKALGGSAVEGVSAAGEKHLFVDLPGGRGDVFRRAVAENSVPAASGSPAPGAARDQLEVIIRPAADDE